MGRGPHRQLEQAWLDRLADADRGEARADRRREAERAADRRFDQRVPVQAARGGGARAARAHDDPHPGGEFPDRSLCRAGARRHARPEAEGRATGRGARLRSTKTRPSSRLTHVDYRSAAILRHARDQRCGARGRRADRLGPVAQRRRDRARPRRHRLRPRRRLRLQISERRARRAGLHLRRRAAAGRAYAIRSRAGWAMPSPSRSSTTTGRPTASSASSPARRRSSRWPRSTRDSTRSTALRCATLQAKSRTLSQLFVDEVEARCGDEVRLASPRDPAQRGSHVVFAHPEGYAVMQALIARGVIGDFRAPDLMRFGFAPLYNSYRRDGPRRRDPRRHPRKPRMGPAALQGAREGHLIGAFRRPRVVDAPRARRRRRRDRGR